MKLKVITDSDCEGGNPPKEVNFETLEELRDFILCTGGPISVSVSEATRAELDVIYTLWHAEVENEGIKKFNSQQFIQAFEERNGIQLTEVID